MNKNLKNAIRIVKRGGIIIFPTDTAFGIGCRVDDENAVRKLFRIRRRQATKAVPVLFSDLNMVSEYVSKIPKDVEEKLINKYWPGGLTLILWCIRVKVSELIRGGGETIGVRIPDHDAVRTLIKRVGVPILGPSANFSGRKTPFKQSDIDQELMSLVDFVLPGRCKIKKPSTIVDCSEKPWKIVRKGAVKIDTRD